MDFWEVLKVVVRRWAVTVPVLVLTVVTAVLLPPRIDPTYATSAATVVIAPMPTAADGLNPFLTLGTVQMALGVAASADSGQAIEEIRAAGGEGSYVVTQQNSRSPILAIQVDAPTAEQAVETTTLVLDLIARQLSERQVAAGAPPETHYYLQTLTGPPSAVPVYDGAQRVRFLSIGLGIGLAVLLALAIEGIAVLRGRRRAPVLERDRPSTTEERLALLEERERLLVERERLLEDREQEEATYGRWAKVGKGAQAFVEDEPTSSGPPEEQETPEEFERRTPGGTPSKHRPGGRTSVSSRPG